MQFPESMTRIDNAGKEHPDVYLSSPLSPAEPNYTIAELVCLAIAWSVLKIIPYIDGDHTDHIFNGCSIPMATINDWYDDPWTSNHTGSMTMNHQTVMANANVNQRSLAPFLSRAVLFLRWKWTRLSFEKLRTTPLRTKISHRYRKVLIQMFSFHDSIDSPSLLQTGLFTTDSLRKDTYGCASFATSYPKAAYDYGCHVTFPTSLSLFI